MSVSEYLVRVRLKKAIGWLVYTDDPIKEIGFRAGFGGPERFSKVFRRWLKCSPRAFRERYRYGNLSEHEGSS
jgi:AraC-like DNA-binding protein